MPSSVIRQIPVRILLLVALFSQVSRQTTFAANDNKYKGCDSADIILPTEIFSALPDGSLYISGHWKLIHSDDPKAKHPWAAQRLNSTIIRCWPTKGFCDEYQAMITNGVLMVLEPSRYEIVSSNGGNMVALLEVLPDTEDLFYINANTHRVEMEFHLSPSPGRTGVFERWELE